MNSGGKNMRVLENVQPQKVFYYFEELAGIPHGSYHTKAISDYCMNFAKERELEAYQDAYNNVVIIKEATAGYERTNHPSGTFRYGLRKRKRHGDRL